MKRKICIINLLFMMCQVYAQIVYHDASEFPLLGKATEATGARYDRLPDSLKNISRAPLWNLSRNSAGMAIRFRSNSTQIAVKWEVLFNNHMNHMTDVGIKGLDLYCWSGDGEWKFVNSGRPSGKTNEVTIIANMQPEEREYMLYLPLYDGLVSLSIGVDSLSFIDQPQLESPIRKKPIVFYGTSILQGGCASRPGMAHTNILSRRLNRECINLGFSGNAFLDLEIAQVISEVDAGVFVLDFVPNASVEQMQERMETFYRIIRSKHPHTPVVFIEDPIFTHTMFDQAITQEVRRKNQTLNEIFDSLKMKGEKEIYLISSKNMLGDDGEATVDGIHFTDLGMMRYADLVGPIIEKTVVSLASEANTQKSTFIKGNDPSVSYIGRTETQSDGSVSFDWTGTYLRTRLSGGELSIKISDTGVDYYNVFVDSLLHKVVKVSGNDTLINFVSGIDKGIHRILIQKRTEGEWGKTTIHQFVLPEGGKLQKETDCPSKHIEFIGNSLTCGFGVEGKDRNEPYKAETENSNLSYAGIIARYFNADYTLIAHSGRGVVRNYGDSLRVSAVTMKDRMLNTFDMNLDKKWDFKAYRPDLVVVNLGSNDFSIGVIPSEDEFIHAYEILINHLRTHYGDVPILCISPAIAQRQIIQYIERMRKKLNDEKVYVAVLPEGLWDPTTDLGAVWHPNYKGQTKMAMSLIPYISTITGWALRQVSF